MVVKVGINGFGRIGRVVFRTCYQNQDIALTAINDPAIDIEYICYLIKFDSTHGRFRKNVTYTDEEIIIDDHKIKIFREKIPRNVPWQKAGVQYVVEASGMFTCLEKAKGHLASEGVKRVIVTAPSIDVPMVIIGVNDNSLSAEHKVLSCASSTLYCLAPIIKVLNDQFGVAEGFMTSIHAMTPSLKPLDGLCLRGKHWRDNRSIHQNIIPARTGACKALGKIIPQVKDKMTGLAFRVPIVNVSVLDISIRLEASTSVPDIVKCVEKASNSNLHNIITTSNEDAVSSDFIGDHHSCILDVDSTLQLKPNFFKLICWYENEYSYACRVIDSIFFSERQFTKSMLLVSKMTYVRPKVAKKQDSVIQTDHSTLKEISIECNYDSEQPKVKCTTSSDGTFKQRLPIRKYRPVYLQKPMSLHNSELGNTPVSHDSKKRNDLFNVWSDDIAVPKNSIARQYRDSLFNSCMAFSNPHDEKAKSIDARERLENVKKEFSKMLDITEDLLKKSYNNKIETAERYKETMVVADAELKGSLQDNNILKIIHKQESNDLIIKECGDFNKNQDVGDSIDESETNQSKSSFISTELKSDKDESEDAILKRVQKENCLIENHLNNEICGLRGISQIETTLNNMMVTTIENSLGNYDCVFKMTNEPTEVENTFNELIKKRLQNCDENEVKIKDIKEGASCSTLTVPKPLIIEQEPMQNTIMDFAKYLESSKEYNMHIIDEELKKRNIILVNLENNLESIESESLMIKGNHHKNMTSDEGLLTGLSNLASKTESMLPDDSIMRCGSAHNTETTISCNGDRKLHKLDLYDKLDSASATDSDNSFQVHERKSQVIHITDLTNSLEDLSRLDKICRIIEISDELSDKLFSNLNNSENINKNNKWSFNDLCERIQLDEFCNKVFNQTNA